MMNVWDNVIKSVPRTLNPHKLRTGRDMMVMIVSTVGGRELLTVDRQIPQCPTALRGQLQDITHLSCGVARLPCHVMSRHVTSCHVTQYQIFSPHHSRIHHTHAQRSTVQHIHVEALPPSPFMSLSIASATMAAHATMGPNPACRTISISFSSAIART